MDKEDAIARVKLGNILKAAREKAGLTQADVAMKAKLSANFYALVERGEETISFDKLQRVLKALHIKSLDV